MWETPRASFIPAQGNALGSSAPNPISAESAIHPSKSVVPTAVFRFDSHEIAGFDQFCLAPLSSRRKIF